MLQRYGRFILRIHISTIEEAEVKYLVKHCDGSRRVIMKETVESDEPVEYLLRQHCRKSVSLVEMCLKRLHEEDPEIGNSTHNRYRITGNEGIVYSIVNGEEWISDIHICTPVGRGIPWKLRDLLSVAKKRLPLTTGALMISLAVSACGGGTKETADKTTSTTAVEASAEETAAEETPAAEETKENVETSAEEGTSAAAKTPAEWETGAELIEITKTGTGSGAKPEYNYPQIEDGLIHKTAFWTDGETMWTDYFKNLYIPEWGVEKITLPASLVEGEAYVLKPGEELTAETARDDQIYDDSVNYAGNFSIRTAYEFFRVWRVNVGDQADLLSMKQEDVYHMVYNFPDAQNYLINLSQFWEFKDGENEPGYILEVIDRGHWNKPAAYRSYILVRVEDGIAHCMQYGDATDDAREKWDYILMTAKFTKIRDITEGKISDAGL